MRLGRTIGTEWHGCGAPAGFVVMVKGDRDEPADAGVDPEFGGGPPPCAGEGGA